ncbi:GH3 family domain-containing protein [Leptospira sp. GIMC2001]|uniref:GH3 family domain-containing protein n=1 Tax=Leptospira sp. GIMC2001 TaxID=1513297 RepID=UPI00234AE4EE|nr:GH3 auxin-responsive promoter family protein [Leptospira sp. GIMC2001]WCL49180.1 GH3 auxin-responsive promoter family protein [Leptospira sp. GIMC2001]
MSSRFIRRLAIFAWKTLAKKNYTFFRNNIHNVQSIQNTNLKNLLVNSNNTAFSRDYDLNPKMNYREYSKQVPIQKYDDLKPYIERIMNGEQNALSKSKIRKINLTSGSSDASKLIPYTDYSAEEFAKSIGVWMYGLIEYRKLNVGGKFYFSITPSGMDSYNKNGVNVGFDNDSDYFGIIEKHISQLIMVTPDSISKIKDLNQVILYTVCYLLQTTDLVLISIWNPSFLQRILDYIFYNRKLVFQTMRIVFRDKISKRIQFIEQTLNNARKANEVDWLSIWPQLKIVSTWTENHAFPFFQNLKSYLPNVEFETKGVVATEGFISVPFYNSQNKPINLLSYTSHFYEFRNRKSEILLIDDLSIGDEVEVIMSLGNGFHRYAIGDWFRINAKIGNLPSMEFIGREEFISDLCGEKINENFLLINLVPKLKQLGILEKDFYIQGNIEYTKAYYNLCILSNAKFSQEKLLELSNLAERILQTNPHYKYARELNQLEKLRIKLIEFMEIAKTGRIATFKNRILRSPKNNQEIIE